MKKILAIGDSNTWGYIPGTMDWSTFEYKQFPRHLLWTGVLQKELGSGFHLVEEAFPGRTILTDDALMEGMNTFHLLKDGLIERERPDLTIIFLGSNDLKSVYQLSPEKIAEQMASLCSLVHLGKILLLGPPAINRKNLTQEWQLSFEGREIEQDSLDLGKRFQELAKKNNAGFFDVAGIPLSKDSDGLHLDEAAHQRLGKQLKNIIMKGY